jgi:hypothetical protein
MQQMQAMQMYQMQVAQAQAQGKPAPVMPKGIMRFATGAGGPGGVTAAIPSGPVKKSIITPQQARLGKIAAAVAAGLLFM